METEKGRTGLLQARGPAGAGLPPSPGVGLCLPQPNRTGTHQPPLILSREHTQTHTHSREARLHVTTVGAPQPRQKCPGPAQLPATYPFFRFATYALWRAASRK